MVAAIRLAELGHDVSVFDPAPHAGGLARGINVGGGSVELFYHHVFRSDTSVARWINDLGLGHRLEFLPATMGFYSQGRLYRFGTVTSLLAFRPLPPLDRLRLGLRIRGLAATASAEEFENVTAEEWLKRRASQAEMDVFWHPLLAAKFGVDRDRVSMAWLWARFRARVGDKVGRRERLGYLRGGFQQLGNAMTERAKRVGVRLQMGTRVTRVMADAGRVRGVETEEHGIVRADAVIWTPSLAVLARAVPELPAEYARKCQGVRYHHAIVALVELERSALPFYWVTVGDAALPFTVAVEHTRMVPASDYGGRTVVYLGRYAPPDDRLVTASDAEIEDLFLSAAAKAFSGAFANPLAVRVFRAPAAQPVVPPGWATDRPQLRTGLPGLVTANMAQIYPWDRGINYSIDLGEEAASAISDELRELSVAADGSA